METASALTSLLLLSHSLGVAPLPKPATIEAPKLVLRIALQDIVRDQERAFVGRQVGRGWISFAVGLDPEADLWVKLREGRRNAAYPLDKFSEGVDHFFPSGRYRFLYENGNIRAFPVSPPQSPQAILSVVAMLRRLHRTAIHVLFTPVEYAVVYERGGDVPDSVSLIREDAGGGLWVTHKSLDEMRKIHWFVSINGTRYGMKLNGDHLDFYSVSAPQAVSFSSESERLLTLGEEN